MGAGDIISQTVIEKKSFKKIDYKRTLQFSSIGFFVGGPALRIWYGLLNKHVGSSGKMVALKKVFVDQFIFAPTFLLFLLISVFLILCLKILCSFMRLFQIKKCINNFVYNLYS
ncbi:hypothetical protein KGM_204421 [Danaus plexippus plexippus]|uniref:Mitochondrial inner membrane protein Mpv17 n=1 Tax=Danaus plexippus plexippus TaxID=278856 RepID=A0A212ELI5_DANPL|nr:hypothetical protein KGM_204421 [Danaus plexippus plexippus]